MSIFDDDGIYSLAFFIGYLTCSTDCVCRDDHCLYFQQWGISQVLSIDVYARYILYKYFQTATLFTSNWIQVCLLNFPCMTWVLSRYLQTAEGPRNEGAHLWLLQMGRSNVSNARTLRPTQVITACAQSSSSSSSPSLPTMSSSTSSTSQALDWNTMCKHYLRISSESIP